MPYKTRIVPHESKKDALVDDKQSVNVNDLFPVISKQIKEKKNEFFKNLIRKNCYSEMRCDQYKDAKTLNKNPFNSIYHKLLHLKTPNRLTCKSSVTPGGKKQLLINPSRNNHLIDNMKSVKSVLKKIYYKKNRTLINKQKLYQRSMHRPYDTEINKEIDWSVSQLYTAALRSDLCFNSEQNAAYFKEEEVSKVLSHVSQLDYRMLQVNFRKACNSIRKIFMEIMHPEFYSAIKAICNNSEDLTDVLRCLEDLLVLRRELLMLFL
jgi:hypothetical protein